MISETFLWSWLKWWVHCRSLHIHVPPQRRACPDAKGKHGEASQRAIHPKNKKMQPLPLLECWEVPLFCYVLVFNHSFGRWATVTHLLRKVHPTGACSSLRYAADKKLFLQSRPCSSHNSCWHSNSNGATVKLKHLQLWWVQLHTYSHTEHTPN